MIPDPKKRLNTRNKLTLDKLLTINKKIGTLTLGLSLTGCATKYTEADFFRHLNPNECIDCITEGEIYGKKYELATTQENYVSIPRQVYLSPELSNITIIDTFPISHYDGYFIIKIKKYNEEKEIYETRAICLDEETFNDLEIGDWYIHNPETE